MGSVYYGEGDAPIQIDDRVLAHLKVVIATKLRRNESFTVSWVHPEGDTPGRSTIWLHPSIPLRFVFDDPDPPKLDQQWIKVLAASAYSTGGINLTAEDLELDSPAAPTPGEGSDVSLGDVKVADLDLAALTLGGQEMKAPSSTR